MSFTDVCRTENMTFTTCQEYLYDNEQSSIFFSNITFIGFQQPIISVFISVYQNFFPSYQLLKLMIHIN